MAVLVTLLLALAAPQADEGTCAATRFTLNRPASPKAEPPKTDPEKRKVAQAAPTPPKPKPTPSPGDCTSEKKKG
jgi:hypothetical protein